MYVGDNESYLTGPSRSGTGPANVNLQCIACPPGLTTQKVAQATIMSCVPIDPTQLPTPEVQRDILLQGKIELLGPHQKGSKNGLQTWQNDTNVCKWHGIQCADGAPLVFDIFISGEQLDGKLPQAWSQAALAATLQTISIYDPLPGSKLSDTTIPESWGSFASLQTLRLSRLHLTGPLPTSWPSSMQRIILDNNKFSGTGACI